MASEISTMKEDKGPILHVIVVGFHHKKGCQVEYSFPPLVEGAALDSNICPPGWKYLPTLALPDGSHNFDEDTVYFHLPSLINPRMTVYGISCFRQIPVERLKNRTADMTRGTVQKSVCVLSALPLFGHIQVKMALITHAYFDEGDFSKVLLLHDTYHHLNGCLAQIESIHTAPQLYVGLSVRDLVLQFRHKALLLFKLLLLERRLVFYRSPVQPLCATILSLLSLHPGMIERGLQESACVKPSRPMSPIPEFTDSVDVNQVSPPEAESDSGGETIAKPNSRWEDVSSVVGSGEEHWEEVDRKLPPSDSLNSLLQRDSSVDTSGDASATTNMAAVAQLNAEQCGVPLPIFTQGYLCHPYLSLPYLDLLSDVNVRGYVVGATNVLFKQKKQLADVLVEVEGARVETQDPELRRQLHLTTEDLRFADFVVRHVAEERHDVFLDGVGWEGGDEWIRAQFRVYLLCLLRTSLLQDGSREAEHFNSSFMSAWKATHNYKMWVSGEHAGIWELNPAHPFAGQLSVADMKLRLSHTMQNTEGGRKLNQAMVSTGRAVATTGRAVGGALSQAKGALSSWWSTLTTAQSPDEEGEMEPTDRSPPEQANQTPGSATDMHRSPTVEQSKQPGTNSYQQSEQSEQPKMYSNNLLETADSSKNLSNEQTKHLGINYNLPLETLDSSEKGNNLNIVPEVTESLKPIVCQPQEDSIDKHIISHEELDKLHRFTEDPPDVAETDMFLAQAEPIKLIPISDIDTEQLQ